MGNWKNAIFCMTRDAPSLSKSKQKGHGNKREGGSLVSHSLSSAMSALAAALPRKLMAWLYIYHNRQVKFNVESPMHDGDNMME